MKRQISGDLQHNSRMTPLERSQYARQVSGRKIFRRSNPNKSAYGRLCQASNSLVRQSEDPPTIAEQYFAVACKAKRFWAAINELQAERLFETFQLKADCWLTPIATSRRHG